MGRHLKRAARWVLGVIALLHVVACTYTMVFKYSCEGKCSGEFSRDVDANSPEQLKEKSK